ncbi:hypothetical protein AAEX28_05070 [Lentisphaerota bacterium WC36G]|nr:hypothetical protein LJT99_07925 [Lentisphaerae bacterium WC36]
MSNNFPVVLNEPTLDLFPALVENEIHLLSEAKRLLELEFPGHSLLNIWLAGVNNIRRRIESYGIELFQSAVEDEAGRKKYNEDGETINERWSGVDDLVLINGASKLGILSKKAGKSLEMINWMRNHASPAHGSDSTVQAKDVIALAIMLQTNLFESEMPDPGHSPSGLFKPIKTIELADEKLELFKDQIKSFKAHEIRTVFGFLLDMICKGEDPSYKNAKELFPEVWNKSNENLKKSAGQKYHSYLTNSSEDSGGKTRVLESLVQVKGVKYIPDAARATIYRHIAKKIAEAKNTSYGWNNEEKAAKSLAQFGPHVPSIAFEDVYQEIIAVWCGNYWGRSQAHLTLKPFIDSLDSIKLMVLARMFKDNERVTEELFQDKPKRMAKKLLTQIKNKLTLEANINEIDEIKDSLDTI